MVASVDSSALVNGVKPFDIAGSIDKGNTALQGEIDTRQKQEAYSDQQVVKDLMSVPGVDYSTPKGIKELMGHLQGRVSPATYMKYSDAHSKMQDTENTRLLNMAKLGDYERKQMDDTVETVASAYDGIDKIEGLDAQQAEVAKRLSGFKEQNLSSGVPRYNAKAIESLQSMPWEQQLSTYKGSLHAKDLLARSKDESQIARLKTLTDNGGGKVENWVGENGEPLLRHQNGEIYKVDLESGETSKLAAMPKGAYKAGTKNPAGIKDSEAVSLSDDENQYIAEYQQTYGKQIPGIPAGSGAAARKARIEYMKAFVRMGKERGYSGDEAGELALTRDASKEAAKRLYTQSKVIEAGEKDLQMVGKVIEDELKKLGGVDSPVVRKYWNKASTDWAGDPQFSGLNASMVNFQEVAARVFSGQSGAGGTPVTYLHLAEQAIGKSPTLEQFSKTNEVMTKLFEARAKSTESAIQSLRGESRMRPKPEGAGTPTGENANKADSPQGATDQLAILEAERVKADKKLADLKANPKANPADVSRAEDDLAGVRREVARAKGGKADAPAPTEKPKRPAGMQPMPDTRIGYDTETKKWGYYSRDGKLVKAYGG
jgi:hypothetical protein